MRKIRIAVLISGGGTNLQALIDAQNAGTLKSGRIEVVISSSPNAYGIVRATEAGIPVSIVCKEKNVPDPQKRFEDQISAVLTEYGAELIVLAGFMHILSADFTSRYPNRIVNVHPSLIPSFCGKGFYGLKVHEAALAYGVKITGATVHFVNEVPDGGRIILQKAVAIRKNDTPEILQKRVMRVAEWKILPQAVETVSREMMIHTAGKSAEKG